MTAKTKKQPEPLSANDRRAIILRAKGGQTAPQIADALGLPVSRVRRHLHRVGVPVKPAWFSPLADVDLVAEVRKLGSVQLVADKYGVTRQAVHRRLAPLLK